MKKFLFLLLFIGMVSSCQVFRKRTAISGKSSGINDIRIIMLLRLGGVRISGAPVFIMGTTISHFVNLSFFSDEELETLLSRSKKEQMKKLL